MPLATVFAALQERFGDEVVFVGPERRDDNSKTPHISWLPVRSRLFPPNRIGGGPRDQGDIARRQWEVEVKIWGKTFEAALALVDRLRAVAHKLGTHFTFPPEGEELWDFGGVASHGVVCQLRLLVMTPVLRERLPTVPVTPVPTLKLNNTPI